MIQLIITESQYEKIVKTLIDEKKKSKKKDTTLCKRGITAAKAKYEVWPSAYSSGYAVQVCKGKMPDVNGNKRCSGKFCPKKKK